MANISSSSLGFNVCFPVNVPKAGRINWSDVDYFLPHISSMFFKDQIINGLKERNIELSGDKWFLNLDKIGNIGAASAFFLITELFHSGRLKKGEKLLLMVPESARFSYTFMHLTVV